MLSDEGCLFRTPAFCWPRNEMLIAPHGTPFYQNHANAEKIIDQVDRKIDEENRGCPDGKQIKKPKKTSRTMLRWVAAELLHGMQEATFVHKNAIKAREPKLPKQVLLIIDEAIRYMVNISAEFGPTKIRMVANQKVDERNAQIRIRNEEIKKLIEDGELAERPLLEELSSVGLTTVQIRYRRYDAWIRLAKEEGVQAATCSSAAREASSVPSAS
jgi:putative transposase